MSQFCSKRTLIYVVYVLSSFMYLILKGKSVRGEVKTKKNAQEMRKRSK